MTAFLTSERVQRAVENLGRSAAKARVGDYLIVKRAIARQEGRPVVELSNANDDWIESIHEFAHVASDDAWEGPHFFNPFGAARDARTAGFRSDKYPSNGSSNTVMDWHGKTDSPIERVAPLKPAHVQLTDDLEEDQLERFFLLSGSDAERPSLVDAAVWWHRDADLDELRGPRGHQLLVDLFRTDLGLTSLEVQTIFNSPSTDDLEPFVTAPERPRPDKYLPAPRRRAIQAERSDPSTIPNAGTANMSDFDDAVAALVKHIEAKGFAFQPWQVAAFVTAVRTKPLVLLAGISGTGKTALPRLVAEVTGATSQTVAVRPDWTDSADLLGRRTLDERFVPGSLLTACKSAQDEPAVERFFVLDEMNIARVEYYMAEVLSRIEERDRAADGRIQTREPLLSSAPDEWAEVRLPQNVALIGSVNMDESTHDFSRKVMDRSFIIEFSDIDLNAIPEVAESPEPMSPWPVGWWAQQHLRLSELDQGAHSRIILETIGALTAVNDHLAKAQLQVGYRVRDEIAMFCVNAGDCRSSFADNEGALIDPLDLAISLKVLPRILGGEAAIRSVLEGLKSWASGLTPDQTADGSAEVLDTEKTRDRYPVCERKIDMMLDRLNDTGYASYWT